jgi:hypothetical protein
MLKKYFLYRCIDSKKFVTFPSPLRWPYEWPKRIGGIRCEYYPFMHLRALAGFDIILN